MSKIGFISDIHFELNSSVLRSSNFKYSPRLDNIVESYKWAINTFKEKNCSFIMNLGDMTNSDVILPEINKALYDALSYWSNLDIKIPQLYLLGNHELKDKNRNFTSVDILQGFNNFDIFKQIEVAKIGSVNYIMVPFDAEDNYDKLYVLLEELKNEKVVICSHAFYTNLDYINTSDDSKTYKSPTGIDYLKVKSYSNVLAIFNGHIHYGWDYANLYHQVGLLTGINFSDYYKFAKPGVLIYDDETNTVERIENPNAIIFEKKQINDLQDLNHLDNFNGKVVYRIECKSSLKEDIKSYLDDLKESNDNLINYKIKSDVELNDEVASTEQINKVELNSYKSPYLALLDFINSEEELPYDKRELEGYLNEYIK